MPTMYPSRHFALKMLTFMADIFCLQCEPIFCKLILK